jgi:TatD DNase family protein
LQSDGDNRFVFVDSHCHLSSPELIGRIPEIREEMRKASVDRALCICTTLDEFNVVHGLALANDGFWCSAGVHPDEEDSREPTVDGLVALTQLDKVVAIGETGLDYFRDYAPRADQERAFHAQIELARATGKPLVIHTRAAEDDTVATLKERAHGLEVVMHCFSMPDRLDECLAEGWWISFAGNVTYPKATDLADAAERVPDDRLLVETDAPYLTPQPVRKERNQPAFVTHTARFVAERRGVAYDELERLVDANAATLFGW